MPYLFGIVLCVTILTMFLVKHRHNTRGERADANRKAEELKALQKKAAKELEDQKEVEGKTCNKGWHLFTRWEDSDKYKNVQVRYCKLCGHRSEQII